MLYREYSPHPALAPHVRCYWSLALPHTKDVVSQRFLAEGVEVSFSLAGTVSIDPGSRPPRTARGAFLSGPMTTGR